MKKWGNLSGCQGKLEFRLSGETLKIVGRRNKKSQARVKTQEKTMTCMKLCCVGSSWGGSKLCCVESRGQTHWGHCACPRKHTYCTREDKHFELIINVLVSTLLILARTSTLSSWSVHFELMVLVLASTFHVFARTSTLNSMCLSSWSLIPAIPGGCQSPSTTWRLAPIEVVLKKKGIFLSKKGNFFYLHPIIYYILYVIYYILYIIYYILYI